MNNDNLFGGEEAVTRLEAGIKKIADAVGSTMGTKGSNAVIEVIESPGHLLTNDGFTIANSIVLSDPIEDMGRKILLESINRANKLSGDGSSTTCVLTAAILAEGRAHMDEASPMEIKRSLEECIPLVANALAAQTRHIEVTEVGKVATISAEDESIGKTIQEIYEKIGKSGIIYWDISKVATDSYTLGSGITIEGAGYASPYMCDANESGQNTNQIRITKPRILLCKQKITSAADFNDLAQALYTKDIRDVVVFCDDFDPMVIPDLVKTRMVRGFRIILVKMPMIWRDEWYEDLALASDTFVVDPALGLRLKDMTPDKLGTVGNITITKDDTFIDGIEDLTTHIAQLIAQNFDETKNRAIRLNTKTARYFVGAESDSALGYRRLKVEDAISSAWQALNGGVVAGGGSALASIELPNTVGGDILMKALNAPAAQIARNAGFPEMNIGPDYMADMGFDTESREFVNMFDAGIVDPANTVLNAVKNAISVAAAVLTATTVVTHPQGLYIPPKSYE